MKVVKVLIVLDVEKIEVDKLLTERSLWNAYPSSTVFCMTRVLDVHLTSSPYTKERYYKEEPRST